MAIYIDIIKTSEDDKTLYFTFYNSSQEEYGTLALDKLNYEVVLLEYKSEMGKHFAFPRVEALIQKRIQENGIDKLPENFSYRA